MEKKQTFLQWIKWSEKQIKDGKEFGIIPIDEVYIRLPKGSAGAFEKYLRKQAERKAKNKRERFVKPLLQTI
jgi:hypothetical protein